MVDVHVGIAAATLGHQSQELGEGGAFVIATVSPQRTEDSGRPGLQHTEEILQAPLPAIGGPQRVTLEVEEQVTRVRFGQQGQRLRVDDLELRLTGGPLQHLQLGLCRQLAERVDGHGRHGAGVLGELPHRADARLDQLLPLGDSHTGDEQQIVGRPHLLDAQWTTETGLHPVVVPTHRAPYCIVLVEQPFQLSPLGPVDRD